MSKKRIIPIIILLVLLGAAYVVYYQVVQMKVPSVRWLLSDGETYIGGSCICPDATPYRKICLYHSKGDDIKEILRRGVSVDCSQLGCASPTEYKYCD